MTTDWLNYHHLFYFWVVVKEGGVTAACRRLRLAQPTISGQIKRLEQSLGQRLFEKSGRGLVLTSFGQMVSEYADEIFTIGNELMAASKQEPTDRVVRLAVGVTDVVPKFVASALLEPALTMTSPEVRLVVIEGKSDALLAELAVHRLDLVLSDAPIPTNVKVKAFNHLLGECPVGLFAVPALAKRLRPRFPASLNDAPLLLPTENTVLRREMDRWFSKHGLLGKIVAECEDSALLKVFGQMGHGAFPAPLMMKAAVEARYGSRLVGELDDVKERFYGISLERRVTHPAVVRITEHSRAGLFAS